MGAGLTERQVTGKIRGILLTDFNKVGFDNIELTHILGNDLMLDSIGTIDLTHRLEEQFGIEIPPYPKPRKEHEYQDPTINLNQSFGQLVGVVMKYLPK